MKPKLYSYLAIVLFAAIFIVACKKGDTGPAGPAGPAGAAGAAGAAGPKGDSATANVTYSPWTDISFTMVTSPNASQPTGFDTLGYTYKWFVPKLTSDILTKGSVHVYWNVGSAASPDVFTLPFFDVLLFGNGFSIEPYFAADTIYLTANFDASSVTDAGVKYQQFRYVLIPGTIPASTNVKDYNAIKNYFKMPD